MIQNPLRIRAKSLSDALAPSKKEMACGTGFQRLCEASAYPFSAHCLPDFCQKGCLPPGFSAANSPQALPLSQQEQRLTHQ